MSNLLTSLYIGLSALYAQQQGLAVSSNNVANANTPGYSRQRALLQPTRPMLTSVGSLGTGVHVASIQAVRDRFITIRLNQEAQRRGELGVLARSLQNVEAIFNDASDNWLQAALSGFFNSFEDLSKDPTSYPLRQQVLSAAQHLINVVRSSYARLEDLQKSTDVSVNDVVREINSLAGRIARLNAEVMGLEVGGKDAASVRDMRQQLLDQLAELVDINYYELEDGSVTVVLRNGGDTLVNVGKSYELTTQAGGSQLLKVYSGSRDVTGQINGGKLGGLLKIRDKYIPSYMGDLDALAKSIVDKVNEQHAQGIDLNGAAGGDFFSPLASTAGAAKNIALSISDPAKIAAAAAGAGPGDNSNALKLADLQNQKLISGATYLEFYSILISKMGGDSRQAQDDLALQEDILLQLQNQRDAISGVSLDEEAANIILYQRAYQSATKLVDVINRMMEEVMSLVGG